MFRHVWLIGDLFDENGLVLAMRCVFAFLFIFVRYTPTTSFTLCFYALKPWRPIEMLPGLLYYTWPYLQRKSGSQGYHRSGIEFVTRRARALRDKIPD